MAIRVMIVDDELPALNRLEKVLREFDNVIIADMFTDPLEFLDKAIEDPVDLVVLDMEMPVLHGMEAARLLHAVRPDILIAFVTAYDNFALEAFDVDALDYLLKPVNEADLRRTLARFSKRKGNGSRENAPNVSIRCLGQFAVFVDGGEPVKFRNSKSKELLAFLHHHRGAPVSKGKIIEALWGGKDSEKSQVNLHSTVYQLRKDLDAANLRDIIDQDKSGGGSYRLLLSASACDAWEFDRACRQHEASAATLENAVRAIGLYGGGYLEDHDWDWATQRRTEFEMRYADLLDNLVAHEVDRGNYRSALLYLGKWVNVSPYSEPVHKRIIALHLLMGNEWEARRCYNRLVDQFRTELDIEPEMSFSGLKADPRGAFRS